MSAATWADLTPTWSDGSLRSINNAFCGDTGFDPVQWSTSATAAYATRLNNNAQGNALDAAGRPTVVMNPHAPGISIATADDKKFKRKQGAAI